MTGRKSAKAPKKRSAAAQQNQQLQSQSLSQQPPQAGQVDETSSPPPKRDQSTPQQTVKKILKAENDEAKTLSKVVFKSNPDIQMKEFIKKAVVKPAAQQATKVTLKTPADAHPPAVAQELLDTDDDVADNLGKLFKTSKSYKNL